MSFRGFLADTLELVFGAIVKVGEKTMPMMQEEYAKLEAEKNTLNRYTDEDKSRLQEIESRQTKLKEQINMFYDDKTYDDIDKTIDMVRGEK